jgi:peptidoglycan/LPS O-acetylase OafA/YrhL
VAIFEDMKRIRQLDAVRGLAVIMVLIHNTDIYPALHLGLFVRDGWMGVDLFFVLSGLLITGVLLDAKNREGYFKNFYARRCLRIWPLYYSSLLFMFVIVPVLHPSATAMIFGARSAPWWAYPLFLQNFLVRIPTDAVGLLAVTWSLAVEEQFYLVWPLVVRFCSESQLRRIALGVILLSPALRYFLSHRGVDIYSNTFCRLDGLMAGALLALLARSERLSPSKFTRLAWILLFLSAPAALILEMAHARWIDFSFVTMAAASFVYLALYSENQILKASLSTRALVYTGTISYGIYLLEKIPIDVVEALHFEDHPFFAFIMTVCATLILATISWNILEKPFLNLKKYFTQPGTANNRIIETIPEAPQE